MSEIISSDKLAVHFLVENLVAMGLKEVVISPGSRNAPLCIAFDEHPQIKCYLIHDERVAGFFAMGLSQASGKPVATVCTSGSAVTNYYPSVVEAYYQCVPLLIISADRPQEWVNHGDGQTIMQNELFGKHVGHFLQLSDGMKAKELDGTIRAELAEIHSVLCGAWQRPVHINFALEEPLYGRKAYSALAQSYLARETKKPDIHWHDLQDIWENSEKKMILVGQMKEDSIVQLFLEEISNDPSVVILVENTSNLKHPRFIHCIDRTLESIKEIEEDYRPDLFITLGGAVVSKKIKSWIRQAPKTNHWRVGTEFTEMNTYRCDLLSFEISAADFLRRAKTWDFSDTANFNTLWKKEDLKAQWRIDHFMENIPFSDLSVFKTIFDFIPEFSSLHLANSSVVRYAQLFDPLTNVHYYSNRGTSGIDGSTSTACGFSVGKPDEWNVLITGDISFFYDSNALWNQHLGPNLRIILINNGGGGIFNIIPGPATTAQHLPYFVAQHTHSAKGICESYKVDYQCVVSRSALEESLNSFFIFEELDRPKVLEVITEGIDSHKVLAEFFLTLK